jgi:hypothetical protein
MKANKLVLCVFGFMTLLLSFAAAEAQVGLVTAPVDGVQGPSARPIFSNCGSSCSEYSQNGYYVSGTGFSSGDGSGQTIAVGFTTKKAISFTEALTPLSIYTGNGGAPNGKVTGVLLKDDDGHPGSPIATLVQVGKLKDEIFTVIKYKPRKPIKLNAKTQYWLCLEETTTDVQATWSYNILGDKTSPIYYNNAASCTAGMADATGSTAPAYAVF